jgi:hypothetical protein
MCFNRFSQEPRDRDNGAGDRFGIGDFPIDGQEGRLAAHLTNSGTVVLRQSAYRWNDGDS